MTSDEPIGATSHADAIYAWDRQALWGDAHMAVPSDLLSDIIDVLRLHLVRFAWPQGTPAQARAYFRLMEATSITLGGLLRSFAARDRHDGVYEVLTLLQNFMEHAQAAQHLEAMRGDPAFYNALIDPLIALHGQIQKERADTMPKYNRGQAGDKAPASTPSAAPEQRPAQGQ